MSDTELYARLKFLAESLSDCTGIADDEAMDDKISAIANEIKKLTESLLPQESE